MEAQLRTLPSNIEVEQTVIGAMIIDRTAIAKVTEALTGQDFYRESHKTIFETIQGMYNKDLAVDILTLIENLKTKDLLDKAGGITYVTEVASSVVSTINLDYYINIVKEKALLRKLIRISSDTIEDCYNSQDNVPSVLEKVEKNIFNLASNKTSSDFEAMSPILERGFIEIEKLYINKGGVTGVSSGFPELDAKTSGFQKGDMILIAARPSMGKTTFAINIGQYAALRDNRKVAVFSLEMSKEQLANKMVCAEANVDMLKLRTGNLDDRDWESIARVSGPLAEAKIFIDDTPGITIMEMRSKCRRLKIEQGIDMIIIDYLQLMAGSSKESRQQEVSEISRSIKALAKEMQCPIIALSQLSRAPEQRNDHRPMLSDLRESGSIEQDADLVMFLYRDEYYNKETEDKNVAECIIAKQRNGPTGTVKLAWIGQYSKFGRLDVIHQDM